MATRRRRLVRLKAVEGRGRPGCATAGRSSSATETAAARPLRPHPHGGPSALNGTPGAPPAPRHAYKCLGRVFDPRPKRTSRRCRIPDAGGLAGRLRRLVERPAQSRRPPAWSAAPAAPAGGSAARRRRGRHSGAACAAPTVSTRRPARGGCWSRSPRRRRTVVAQTLGPMSFGSGRFRGSRTGHPEVQAGPERM
jgi:hypothetical protein